MAIEELSHSRENDIASTSDRCEIPGLHPPVEDLKVLIETSPKINMIFHQMFDQVPLEYQRDTLGNPQVRDYCTMLRLINRIMTRAPEFTTKEFVGLPIYAILNWPMATVGGYAVFLDDRVNVHFKAILNYWGEFLKSPESCYVLNNHPEKGWFGRDAMKAMKGFVKDFVCDPFKPHYGFTSWDNFFTRQFREGRRPVASPDDNKIIVNACESVIYNIQFNVRHQDQFWIKSQPYSLQFMLANDPLEKDFVGGTVYQAYLTPLMYHRWHSPVDGVIRKAYAVEGSYFSALQFHEFYFESLKEYQSYLTEVAARAIIFIEADNKYIGLMAFLAVGMSEVSSTEIIVHEGQHVRKGQQIGMFHYGGSTHCLVFRPGVNVEFIVKQKSIGSYSLDSIPVNSKIASVPYSLS